MSDLCVWERKTKEKQPGEGSLLKVHTFCDTITSSKFLSLSFCFLILSLSLSLFLSHLISHEAMSHANQVMEPKHELIFRDATH